jgi:hypothetical protein
MSQANNPESSSVASHTAPFRNAMEQLRYGPSREKIIKEVIDRVCYPTPIQGRYGNWMSFTQMLDSFFFTVMSEVQKAQECDATDD